MLEAVFFSVAATVDRLETPGAGAVEEEEEEVSGVEDEKRLDRARRRRCGSGRDVGMAGLS